MFPGVAVTNYHKQEGLRQQIFTLLSKSTMKVWQFRALSEGSWVGLFLVFFWWLLSVLGVPSFRLIIPVSASPSHGTFPVCLCLSSSGHWSFDLGHMPIQDDHVLTNYICNDTTPKSDLWFQVDINFGGGGDLVKPLQCNKQV